MPDMPAGVKRDYPLARLTTIRTGGDAELFARPGSLDELERLLAWADAEHHEVGVVGSGSNLLVADAGVRGLVLKLDKELSTIELEGTQIRCGGGARLPSVSARAAQAGLTGIEFGVNIPGTVGGAVRMNANAYGGELARVLEWVDVAGPAGTERRIPEQLGFAYRRSSLGAGEVVARASFALSEAESAEVKSTLADMRARRKAAQPSGIKTFGSTFKNPDDPAAENRTAGQLLDAAGCRGLRIGGAGFSAKHANFVENHGDATTADVVAVMAEGRRRVKARFGIDLEPEVQALGPVELPRRVEAGMIVARGRVRFRVKLVVAGVATLAVLAGAWVWLRDSSFVAVKRVTVTGVSGPDAARIRSVLTLSARNMTTLDVRIGQLRTAVAPYPIVKDLQVKTQFPHGIRIHVIEDLPVGVIVGGGESIAASSDGTLLHDAPTASLPQIPLPSFPGGSRVTDGSALDALALLAAAPYRLLPRISQVTTSPPHGLVVSLRSGPSIYFGDAGDLTAKWTAATEVLAAPTSAGATYIDVTDPNRPVAGVSSGSVTAAGLAPAASQAATDGSPQTGAGSQASTSTPGT